MGRTVMSGERVPTDAAITLVVGSGQGEEEFFDYDDDDNGDATESASEERAESEHSDIFDYD